ncbi:MAG: flavodoxin [Bacteroidales bacterium]|nr:flavodoxin [Bacteroidales bacterium]
MKKIALIYSFNSKKTSIVAEKIWNEFTNDEVDKINAETIDENVFKTYNNFIVGVSTWFDGELPNYWDEFVPALEDIDLKGKTIAIFGTGNQRDYPENFVDGIGILGKLLDQQGAKLIGETSIDGYSFEKSAAVRNENFIGLAIDQDTQAKLTNERVKNWIKKIKPFFK